MNNTRYKAVTYNRVSTDEEMQVNALKTQIEESKNAVRINDWDFVDEYTDEGKSGTQTDKRNEYKRLFDDLSTDKFDIVVVKSQDRLMRNTKDWYIFIDRLLSNNKKLYFYLDNTFYSPSDNLYTGIKAILAEEYSRDLSKKINNAHRGRQAKGGNVIITSNTWGYDKNKLTKEVTVNEKEAEMIKIIFDLACQNKGSRTIAITLQNLGYLNRNGKKLQEAVIRRIIRNPMYYGTVIMNKTHYDFNLKRTFHNDPSEWIYHENIIPAIIEKETFIEANRLMDNRTKINKASELNEKRKGVKNNQHHLSGKMICGSCGETFWRQSTRNTKKEIVTYLSCSRYLSRGRKTVANRSRKETEDNVGCDSPHIKEQDLNDVLYSIAKRIYAPNNEVVVQKAMKILYNVIVNDDTEEQLKLLKNNINKNMNTRSILLDKMLEGMISDEVYKAKDKSLKEEYDNLYNKINQIESQKTSNEEKLNRIKNIQNEVKDLADKDLSVKTLTNHIEKIVVYDKEFVIHFDILEPQIVKINRINYKKVDYICL